MYKNAAYQGQESVWAAAAALCASEQNRFWDYHDMLFEHWAGENQGAFTKAKLKAFGSQLGLGSNFAACVDSGKYEQQVLDETQQAKAQGITGTPTFFVNNTRIVGAQPFEAFRSAIEAALH